MQRAEPKVYRLSDYQPSSHLIKHIDLTLDLSQSPVKAKSVLTVTGNPASDLHSNKLVLDGENMQLHAVRLNGKLLSPSDYILTDKSLTILNTPADSEFTIESETTLGDNPDLFGLYQTEGTYLAKAETEGLRRILYCLDRPDVLAAYTTTIIADRDAYPVLLSNGNEVKRETLPDNKHSATWFDAVPKPSYLFALVAGKLEKSVANYTTKTGRDLPIEFFIGSGATDKCQLAKEFMKKAMRWDEDTFGLECDLQHQMVAGVNKYASGASEPTGLILFNTENLFATSAMRTDNDILRVAEVVSHEFFHYWSGDRVTLRDWFNLTFKEGLTTFRAAMFREQLFGSDLVRIMDGKNLDERAPRPDSYTAVRSLYTAAAYQKSGDIFRMIMKRLGEDVFYPCMNKFFREHDGGAVTLEQLIDSLSASSGQDLTPFLTWFTQPGIPEVTVTDEYDSAAQIYTLNIKQSSTTPNYKIRPIPIVTGLIDQDGNEVIGDQMIISNKAEMNVSFANITSRPVPSLLRGFSAPVNLHFDYKQEELLLLMQSDTNLYNRREASQRLIQTLVQDYCARKPLNLSPAFFAAYQSLLKDQTINEWVLAEIINLPSEESLIDLIKTPDFEKIREARDLIFKQIASELRGDLMQRLAALNQKPDNLAPQFSDFDINDAGRRRLHAVCSSYLSVVNADAIKRDAVNQFEQSLGTNMTSTVNAMTLLTSMNCAESGAVLEKFYEYWKDDVSAINYWLKTQASAHTATVVAAVSSLLQHPAFDLTNPNKVYALLGTFIRNPSGFHDKTGAGYKLVANVIVQLDKLNPAVAARLAESFIRWDKYDPERQRLMYQEIKSMNASVQSVNVKDVMRLALEKGEPKQGASFFKSLFSWMRPRPVATVEAIAPNLTLRK